jgi:hypothetical protein
VNLTRYVKKKMNFAQQSAMVDFLPAVVESDQVESVIFASFGKATATKKPVDIAATKIIFCYRKACP